MNCIVIFFINLCFFKYKMFFFLTEYHKFKMEFRDLFQNLHKHRLYNMDSNSLILRQNQTIIFFTLKLPGRLYVYIENMKKCTHTLSFGMCLIPEFGWQLNNV